jgi:hypothetical protein
MGQIKSRLQRPISKFKKQKPIIEDVKIAPSEPITTDAPPQLPQLRMPLSTVTGIEEMYGETTPDSFPRIYLFGDSLTDRAFFESDNGFGWKLREYYDGRVEVVNRGEFFSLLFFPPLVTSDVFWMLILVGWLTWVSRCFWVWVALILKEYRGITMN